MRNINLDNNVIDYNKLLEYGFKVVDNNYSYEHGIIDNKFKIVINIKNNKMVSKVIDNEFNDEYLMVDIVNSTGEYVGKIKEEYEKVINDIIKKCSDYQVFEYEESLKVIKYVKDKYGDDVEYLWPKFPKNAVARNKINKTWYLAILTVKEDRLDGLTSKEIEVIDIRYQKDKIDEIVDNKNIFSGYHMNKKSWITIKLDGSFDMNRLYELIDNSYELSIKK